MRIVSFILALVFSWSALASDPLPTWGANWSANVTNTYCEVRRDYMIPQRDDRAKRGFLANTSFQSAFVRFATTTKTHGSIITPDQLDILRFDLYVYPEKAPVPAQQRILSANIGGFEAAANVVSTAEIHIFSLAEADSSTLLQRFLKNEVVEFRLRFADQHEAEFKIYPAGDRNFDVLVGMFETCVQLNRRPN